MAARCHFGGDGEADVAQSDHQTISGRSRGWRDYDCIHAKRTRLHVCNLNCHNLHTISHTYYISHSGHNILPYVPKLPGQETATFPIKHNNEIRESSEIPDSDVIVIGAGPSAMDMVQEACLAQKATNVHVVARIAHW